MSRPARRCTCSPSARRSNGSSWAWGSSRIWRLVENEVEDAVSGPLGALKSSGIEVLTHYYGARTSREEIQKLEEPLKRAVNTGAVLILAQLAAQAQGNEEVPDDDEVGDDTLTCDAACLTSLLVVADLLGAKKLTGRRTQAFDLAKGATSSLAAMCGTCQGLSWLAAEEPEADERDLRGAGPAHGAGGEPEPGAAEVGLLLPQQGLLIGSRGLISLTVRLWRRASL